MDNTALFWGSVIYLFVGEIMFGKNKQNKHDKKDKIIKIQQDIIDGLKEDISNLKVENESLKKELDFEKNKPKLGYEKSKQMISDLENKKHEYQMLIEELKNLKVSYDEKMKEMSELKEAYKKKMDSTLKKTKKVLKKI